MKSLRELGKDRWYEKKTEHFFDVYERHFGMLRSKPVRLLEIGIFKGASLRMWRDYFENGDITGIDIDANCKQHAGDRIRVFIGKQADTAFLAEVLTKIGTPDIIIDDGSHHMVDQIATFKYLFPLLKPGGLYIIEDLHTSYWRVYGGNPEGKGTCITMLKDLIDCVNWWSYRRDAPCHPDDRKDPKPTEEELTLKDLHFYEGIAVIEKRFERDRRWRS